MALTIPLRQLGRSLSTRNALPRRHFSARLATSVPLRQDVTSKWTNLLTTVHGVDHSKSDNGPSSRAIRENEKRAGEEMEASSAKVLKSNQCERAKMLYSLSFATPFSDFIGEQSRKISFVTSITNPSSLMQKQMDHALQHRRTVSSSQVETHAALSNIEAVQQSAMSGPVEHDDFDSVLPRTLKEALQDSTQARVITKATSPFEIVSVNSAWEDLCGYKKEECIGKTLSILQGPDTDAMAATSIIGPLMNGQEVGTVLVNYDKNGRKFYNRLRACPLSDNSQEVGGQSAITHFLGVLLEVNRPLELNLAI